MTSQRRLPHEHRPHRVYVLRGSDGAVLYVGCTSNFPQRLADHLRSQPWRDEIDTSMTVLTDEMPWEEALATEEAAIEQYAPKHNARRTNGSLVVSLGLREHVATERLLKRAAATGDPQAVAELDAWQDEQMREASTFRIDLPA